MAVLKSNMNTAAESARANRAEMMKLLESSAVIWRRAASKASLKRWRKPASAASSWPANASNYCSTVTALSWNYCPWLAWV
jgi:2-iminoacetate synthase ThiH